MAFSVARWDFPTLTWLPLGTNESLAAGSVLWLQAATNAVLTFTGTYSDPTNSPVAIGPNFLPVPGLEVLNLSTNNSRLSTNQWHYDAQNQLWQIALAVPLTNFNLLPTTLAPGEVLFVRADAATQLTPTDPTLRLRYYHEDHLGSSSVLTDANGQLVEEIANHPFGEKRNEANVKNVQESYQFTQKERDVESLFDYFEARYFLPGLARFSSVDPISDSAEQLSPQKANPYGYCENRPMTRTDPTGLADQITPEQRQQIEKMDPPMHSEGLIGVDLAKEANQALGVGAEKLKNSGHDWAAVGLKGVKALTPESDWEIVVSKAAKPLVAGAQKVLKTIPVLQETINKIATKVGNIVGSVGRSMAPKAAKAITTVTGNEAVEGTLVKTLKQGANAAASETQKKVVEVINESAAHAIVKNTVEKPVTGRIANDKKNE